MPTLLSATMIVACGSDSEEPIENVNANDSVIVQQGLLDADWNEDGAFCTASETIPTVTKEIVARLLSDETVMPRLEAGRLFFDTSKAEQLVFSGRPKQASEPC